MGILAWIGIGIVVLGALCQLMFYGAGAVSTLRSSKLDNFAPRLPEGRPWPRVSLVVPACNEALTIGDAARTLLRIDYPDLELIFVNDRSEDKTGAILDQLVGEDPRARVIHLQDLPAGWLGKVHAMHVATQQASGEFLLFTDADVHFAPDCLRRAVAWMEAEELGHLTLMPRMTAESLAMSSLISAFGICYLAAVKAWRIGRPGSRSYAGIGAFGLVRRSEFERTRGWEWLRLEVGDDVGLGMMMVRQAGARSRFGLATEYLTVCWYDSVGALIRGLEKNAFGVMCGYKPARAIGVVPAVAIMALAPSVALALPLPWLQALGALVWLVVLFLSFTFHARIGQSFLGTLLSPLALLLLPLAVLRSARATLRTKGIHWRGTFYPLAELKEGRRVDL